MKRQFYSYRNTSNLVNLIVFKQLSPANGELLAVPIESLKGRFQFVYLLDAFQSMYILWIKYKFKLPANSTLLKYLIDT